MLPNATKSKPTVTPTGEMMRSEGIEGLTFTDVRSVVSHSGVVTELWRPEWLGEATRPGHVVHVTLNGFAETSWHCHKIQNDLLFVIRGALKIAFYDDRDESPTYRQMDVLPFSQVRPTLIGIPPGVWHALKNAGAKEAGFITMNSKAFAYDDPDDWRLPAGDPSLPRPF